MVIVKWVSTIHLNYSTNSRNFSTKAFRRYIRCLYGVCFWLFCNWFRNFG